MYCIQAKFALKPAHRDDFLKALLEDARDSLLKERDCFTFNVSTDEENPNIFYLFEAYRNKGFETHKKTTHYMKFSKTIEESWYASVPEVRSGSSVFPVDTKWSKQTV